MAEAPKDGGQPNNGNRTKRRGRWAAPVLAGVALVAGGVVADRVVRHDTQEVAQRTAEVTHQLGGRILDMYQRAPAEQQLHYDPSQNGDQTVGVRVKADSKVGGSYGEYYISATMPRNDRGQLDPGQTTMVMVNENVVDAAAREAILQGGELRGSEASATEGYYGVEFIQTNAPVTDNGGVGEWNILESNPLSGLRSPRDLEIKQTKAVPNAPDNFSELHWNDVEAAEARANMVLDWAGSTPPKPVDNPPPHVNIYR